MFDLSKVIEFCSSSHFNFILTIFYFFIGGYLSGQYEDKIFNFLKRIIIKK